MVSKKIEIMKTPSDVVDMDDIALKDMAASDLLAMANELEINTRNMTEKSQIVEAIEKFNSNTGGLYRSAIVAKNRSIVFEGKSYSAGAIVELDDENYEWFKSIGHIE